MARRTIMDAVVEGSIDYGALDAQSMRAEIAAIGAADLSTAKRDASFLINAYNKLAIFQAKRLGLRPHGWIFTLKNPLLWLAMFVFLPVRVAGRWINLYWLEFGWMRPFIDRDPRIHFALNCASTSCPPLPGGEYSNENLDAQLELAARAFFRPELGYRLDRQNGVLYVSRICKWYKGQLAALGTPADLVRKYGAPDDAQWLGSNAFKTKFMTYDWSLNQAK